MNDKPKVKPLPTNRATPRAAISNLAVATKMFRPIIVDDNGERWNGKPSDAPPGFKWNGEFEPRPDLKPDQIPPTFHQLIQAAGNAMEEIFGFIQNHEALKSVLTATQRAFAEVETVILGETADSELKPATTIAEAKRLKKEHTQMRDVLEKAASGSPEQALKAAQSWIFPNGSVPSILKLPQTTDPSAN